MIKEYFDSLIATQPSAFVNEDSSITLPDEMKKDGSPSEWKYAPSSVSEQQIAEMQEKYGVVFPEIYKEFISTYAHCLKGLSGKLDNFLFEDDVDVVLEIPAQVYGKELEEITELFDSNLDFIKSGYLPLGEFDESGIIGLDIDTGEVMWVDYDEYYECESKDDIEESGIVVFEAFEDLLDCFFKKEVYVCPDEEE